MGHWRNMKFSMKTGYSQFLKLYVNIVYELTVANIATMQNLQVTSYKF